jgi:hypothetical protein
MTTLYLSLNDWLNRFGFKYYEEVIFLALIPIGLIGFFLNILAFFVLRKDKFKLPIFDYFRIYTLNSAIICLLMATKFLNSSRRFFSFSKSEWTAKYSVYFNVPMINALFFYSSCLDNILTVDRIVIFSKRFIYFKKTKPLFVSLVLLAVCALLSVPFWLNFTTKEMMLPINDTEVATIFFTVPSNMRNLILVCIANFIIDTSTFIIEMPLNIATIILLKRYLNKRMRTADTSKRSVEKLSKATPVIQEETCREKKLQVKVTILVVIMASLSLL